MTCIIFYFRSAYITNTFFYYTHYNCIFTSPYTQFFKTSNSIAVLDVTRDK